MSDENIIDVIVVEISVVSYDGKVVYYSNSFWGCIGMIDIVDLVVSVVVGFLLLVGEFILVVVIGDYLLVVVNIFLSYIIFGGVLFVYLIDNFL